MRMWCHVQTHDILKAAPATAHALAGAASLECWGGATYDGAAIVLLCLSDGRQCLLTLGRQSEHQLLQLTLSTGMGTMTMKVGTLNMLVGFTARSQPAVPARVPVAAAGADARSGA